METGPKRINTPPEIEQHALKDDPDQAVGKMLASTGKVWSTIQIKPEEAKTVSGELTAEDLVKLMKIYACLNQKEWTSKLWEITMKTNPTPEEKLIVKHKCIANQVRIDIQKEEQAKTWPDTLTMLMICF